MINLSERELLEVYHGFFEKVVAGVSCGSLTKKEKPSYLDLITLVSQISKLNLEYKVALIKSFYEIVRDKGEDRFPIYLHCSERKKLEEDLAYDEMFCQRAGISYVNFDRHIIDIDLALAVFYVRQIREFLETSLLKEKMD